MRVLHFLTLLWICIASVSSSAQEPDSEPSVATDVVAIAPDEISKITYFLIDASGSMGDADPEAEVSAILAPLKGKGSYVFRKYFQADNWNACLGQIKFPGSPVLAEDSLAENFQPRDDHSPLGSALRDAILDATARKVEADIYLISDAEQSNGCGPDICAVASALLPLEDINVVSLTVNSALKANRDRLGCIDAAQSRSTTRKGSDNGGNGGAIVPTPLERWTWLIIFVAMALLAAWSGLMDANSAMRQTSDADEARSLWTSVQRGDSVAESELRSLIAKYQQSTTRRPETEPDEEGEEAADTTEANAQKFRTPGWAKEHTILSSFPKALFLFCVVMLLALAVSPGNWLNGDYRLSIAQAAAWDVLDSDFSTAFAGTWIVLIWFMGAQFQRRTEATHKRSNAINESRVAVSMRLDDEQKEANKKYRRLLKSIRSLPLDPPATPAFEETGDGEQFLADFTVVRNAAIRFAIAGEALPNDAQTEQLVEVSERLENYLPPETAWWQDEKNWTVSAFVRRLRAEDELPDKRPNEWDTIADSNSEATIAEAIQTLAIALRSENEQRSDST